MAGFFPTPATPLCDPGPQLLFHRVGSSTMISQTPFLFDILQDTLPPERRNPSYPQSRSLDLREGSGPEAKRHFDHPEQQECSNEGGVPSPLGRTLGPGTAGGGGEMRSLEVAYQKLF